MTKKILLAALIASGFCGCHSSPQKIKYEKDSVKLKQDFLPGVSGPAPKAQLQDEIIGIWTDGSDENATMQIKQDSVYYPDQFKSYKYLLSSDTIRIFYDEYTYKAHLSFRIDTLLMDSKEDESSKFWKFKN